MLLSVYIQASDAYIDGIYYDLSDSRTATVTHGDNAYTGSVTIPSSIIYNGETYSVTSIGGEAFRYCRNLTSVAIPNSVTRIGDRAFLECEGLTSVSIPNSVTSIGKSAFGGCSELTSVTISEGVRTIAQQAFNDCGNLTSIVIPASVDSIGSSAFNGCYTLASISVATGNATYDSRDNCNAIIETASNTLIAGCKNTVIPESVTAIGDGAFNYCFFEVPLVLPDGLKSIGENAFSSCQLSSIIIPKNVSSIGSNAFSEIVFRGL